MSVVAFPQHLQQSGDRQAAEQAMVARFLGLPQDGWQILGGDIAGSSHTWLHPEWVLQQRPAIRYSRMSLLMEHAARMDGLFPGFRYHGPLVKVRDGQAGAIWGKWLGADSFWMAQPRLSGEMMFHPDISPQQILDNLAVALPGIARELDLLAGQEIDFQKMSRCPPTHGIVQQNTGMACLLLMPDMDPALRRIADQISWAEPTSPLVASHGDPTLKNCIWHQGQAHLIDWESVWLLPRHRDFTHGVAFLCKYLPSQYWQRLIDLMWSSAGELLPEWHANTWQQACIWQILREAIFFPPAGEDAYQQYLQGLQELVDSLTF